MSNHIVVQNATSPGRVGNRYPALDGLRGIAILGVLFFHAFSVLKWKTPSHLFMAACFKIGWMGVDMFFVISGFLITGILLDSQGKTGHFRRFYARRCLRIIPAYYLLLAVVLFIVPWVVPFDTAGLKIIEHRQAWLWAHLTNMSFIFYHKVWTHADWLDLNHLWSLAVEEQFYLFWPLVIYLLNRRGLKLVCYSLIAGSLVLRLILWQTGQRNGAIYFPTPCRLDGLAMGAVVAVLIREGRGIIAKIKIAKVTAGIAGASLVGLALLRGGIVFTDKPTVVFGVALISLLAACVVLLVTQGMAGDTLVMLLSNRFLRMTGKYSYGLYLFHNVLLAPLALIIPADGMVKAANSELVGNLAFVSIFIALSYAITLLSWHAYEKHWLKLKRQFEAPEPDHSTLDATLA